MLHNRIAEMPKYEHVLAQPVVTAIGHIDGRWKKELEKPSSILGITTWIIKTLDHMNAKLSNVKILKW
jgi:hypothetical protein